MGKASGDREARVAGGRCRGWGARKGPSPEEPSLCLYDRRVLRMAELLESSDQGVIGLPYFSGPAGAAGDNFGGVVLGGQAPA